MHTNNLKFSISGCRGGSVAVSDDAEHELWNVLGSNPALHP